VQLPRLLYIGDVTVAHTSAGEALLYRLLQSYPPERLALICGVRSGAPLLPGAAYHHWGATFPRLLHSRIAEEYILWRAWKYYQVPAVIAAIAEQFKPDAILTVSHVSAWLCAWQLGVARRIPLHMVVHDDYVYSSRFPGWSRPWAEKKFGEAYRAAAGRFCVSDTMAEEYQRRFGVPGSVIYPTREAGQPLADVAPRLSRAAGALTFAYGGSINDDAQLGQIMTFARVAGAAGHRLIVYTPQHAVLRERVRDVAAMDLRAPVAVDDLPKLLREEADCLFLPQSMDERHRSLVSTAFPTKWADYSNIGLPLIVWAPPWSCSTRFIADHPGCAELITTHSEADLSRAIAKMAESPEYRIAAAQRLLAAGAVTFSPERAWQTFHATLTI
jgi:hypothetical protein